MNLKAVVTGTGRGLGYELSKILIASGYEVVSVGRSHSDCHDQFTVDFSASENVLAIGKDILRSHPDLNLLILNAGILGEIGPTTNVSLSSFKQSFEVNFFSQKALLDTLVTAPNLCAIVNISSGSASNLYAGWSAYGLSKGAMLGLMSYLAVENPRLNILNINPGPMATEMNWDVRRQSSDYDWAIKFSDDSRLMPPEVAAQKILHLCEARLSGDNGEVIDLRKV